MESVFRTLDTLEPPAITHSPSAFGVALSYVFVGRLCFFSVVRRFYL